VGGLIVLGGMFLLAYNFYKTAQQRRGAPAVAAIPQPV
jgi:cbb3-type cytochrome oxidase subunit 1